MVDYITVRKFFRKYKDDPGIALRFERKRLKFIEGKEDEYIIEVEQKRIKISSVRSLVAQIMFLSDGHPITTSKVDKVILENNQEQYEAYMTEIIGKIKILDSHVLGTEILQRMSRSMALKFDTAFAQSGYTAGANAIMTLTEPLLQMSLSSAKNSGRLEQQTTKSGIKEFFEILKTIKEPRDPVIEANFLVPKTVEEVFAMRGEYNHIDLVDLIEGKTLQEKELRLGYVEDGFEEWVYDYLELKRGEIDLDLDDVERYLIIDLKIQLLYDYGLSPYRIVEKMRGFIENVVLIPSYFHVAQILVIPTIVVDDEEEEEEAVDLNGYLYAKIDPLIKTFHISGIDGIKQIFPVEQPLWRTLEQPRATRDRGVYYAVKTAAAMNMQIPDESYIAFFEYMGFENVEVEEDGIYFDSDDDPIYVHSVFAKYMINRDPKDRYLMLLGKPETLDFDRKYTKFNTQDAKILERVMGDDISDVLAELITELGGIDVEFVEDGFTYDGNPDLESFFISGTDDIFQATEYENLASYVYLRVELKTDRKNTIYTLYGLLRRPEINKNNIWTDDNQALNKVFGIEITKANILNRLSVVLSGGGAPNFQRRHIELTADLMTRDGGLTAIEYRTSTKNRTKDVIAAAAHSTPAGNIAAESVFGALQASHVNLAAMAGSLPDIGTVAGKVSKFGVPTDDQYVLTAKELERLKHISDDPSWNLNLHDQNFHKVEFTTDVPETALPGAIIEETEEEYEATRIKEKTKQKVAELSEVEGGPEKKKRPKRRLKKRITCVDRVPSEPLEIPRFNTPIAGPEQGEVSNVSQGFGRFG